MAESNTPGSHTLEDDLHDTDAATNADTGLTETLTGGDGSRQPGQPNEDQTTNTDVSHRPKPCGCTGNGCGRVLVWSLAYFGAAQMFLLGVNVGFLPKAPFPVIGNVLPLRFVLLSDEAILIPMIAWGLHYLRRFGEVLFLDDYRQSMPWGVSVGASVYYWGFGFWIGYSANFKLGYLTPTWQFLVPGMILFVIGEVGSCAVHLAQRQLRKRPGSQSVLSSSGSQHVMPTGVLFKYVSCPNYTFEIISWIGFGFMTFTLPAALFLLTSLTVMLIIANRKHKAYKAEFDGKEGRPLYPEKRKAIIPFIF